MSSPKRDDDKGTDGLLNRWNHLHLLPFCYCYSVVPSSEKENIMPFVTTAGTP